MARPTLWQSLLGKPSQSYSFPEQKDYHSSKPNMYRVAADLKHRREQEPDMEQAKHFGTDGENHSHPTHASLAKSEEVVQDEEDVSDHSSEASTSHEVFYTPTSSPRTSLVSPTLTRALSSSGSDVSTSTTMTVTQPDDSVFSEQRSESSTRMTTPAPSDIASPSQAVKPTRKRSNKKRAQSAVNDGQPQWDRDVRWLVPPSGPNASPSKRQSNTPNGSLSRSQTTKTQARVARTTPTIMTSMTALFDLEEEPGGLVQMYQPTSNVLIPEPHPYPTLASDSYAYLSGSEGRSNRPIDASTSRLTRPRSRSLTSRSRSTYSGSQSSFYTAHTYSSPYSETQSQHLSMHSHGTSGYTSLVLPRAPPPASLSASGLTNLRTGKVDITKTGLAQTTMASVEVINGLSGVPQASVALRMFRFNNVRKKALDAQNVGPGLAFTHHRAPPKNVPGGSVLVQVWGVGLDGVDLRLVGGEAGVEEREVVGRSVSMKTTRLKGADWEQETIENRQRRNASEGGHEGTSRGKREELGKWKRADVGYIPGRSFVGRVVELGWEVDEGYVKRGEWVIGLCDVRKAGALTEFITVDRHRIHRIPHPRMDAPRLFEEVNDRGGTQSVADDAPPTGRAPFKSDLSRSASTSTSRSQVNSHTRPTHVRGGSDSAYQISSRPFSTVTDLARRSTISTGYGHTPLQRKPQEFPLNLEELALLPLCGVPAYRAVQTFTYALGTPSSPVNTLHSRGGEEKRKRVLILRGDDGVGAFAAQLLVKRGWHVCIHACHTGAEVDVPDIGMPSWRKRVHEQVQRWGVEEVVFGREVETLERLATDGEVFDAVLDTIGGKAVREAGVRLLRRRAHSSKRGTDGEGNSTTIFTTLVGDTPDRVVPSAKDHFRAGQRSRDGKEVEYAWVNVAQDVDWEGQDVRETMRLVLKAAVEEGLRPFTGLSISEPQVDVEGKEEYSRVLTLENAPDAFVGRRGVLRRGGTLAVKVAG